MVWRRKWDGNELAMFRRHARPGEITRVEELGREVQSHTRLAKALQEERRIIIRRVYSRGRMREDRTKEKQNGG